MQSTPWSRQFGNWVAQRARLIAWVWLALFIGAACLAPFGLKRLVGGSGELPRSEAAALDRTLREHFETPLAGRLVVVLETRTRPVDAPELAPVVAGVAPALRRVPIVGAVEGPFHRGDMLGGEAGGHHRSWIIGLKAGDARTSQDAVRALRAAIAPLAATVQQGDPEALLVVTGGSAVNEDIGQRSKADGQRAELWATPLTMAALWFAFRSVGATLLPLLSAGLAITLTFAVAFTVSLFTPLSDLMENLVTMVGLAVGIDYALLTVSRWRHERTTTPGPEAVARAVAFTAPAILVSGGAVLCGTLGLALAPLLELRSMSLGGSAVVVFSMAGAVTLLPALLVLLGDWVEWPASPDTAPHDAQGEARWERLAERLTARPWQALSLGLLLIALLAAPALTFQTGAPRMSDFPKDMESAKGLQALARMGVGNQVFDIPILIETTDGTPVLARQHLRTLHAFVRELERDEHTLRVLSPLSLKPAMSFPAVLMLWHDWPRALERLPDARRLLVSRDGQRMLLTVVLRDGVSTIDIQAYASKLRDKRLEGAFRLRVGGQPTYLNELEARLHDATLPVLGGVALLTGGLLAIAFRSLLIPLKAIALNLLSVAAGFGVVTAVCEWGWGASLIGLSEPLVRVPPFVPLLLFCIMFGLSMDYEVFMLSRVRERLLLHGDQPRAIREGLAATGPVITHAAAIMVIVFGAFIGADILVVKVLGLGLATAVLVDACLIRTLMAVPLLLISGKWNWFPGKVVPPSNGSLAKETLP